MPVAVTAKFAAVPATALVEDTLEVMTGAVTAPTTVSVTTELVTLLAVPETTTRYLVPVIARVVVLSVRVGAVAPELSTQVLPPLVLDCHLYASPSPLATTVKLAALPAVTVWSAGCELMLTGVADGDLLPPESPPPPHAANSKPTEMAIAAANFRANEAPCCFHCIRSLPEALVS